MQPARWRNSHHARSLSGDDYDLAGFCVGVVEKKNLISGREISDGDVLIGVQSSGIPSNGFSLVRKVVFDAANWISEAMLMSSAAPSDKP